jgi:DNA-binding Lrp family transcriptional regulator
MTNGTTDLKERDVAILQELARDSQLSMREIAALLEENHDIDVSHVTVSESICRMRREGAFREAILPNEEFYRFALFEFKLNPEQYGENYRAAMDHIRDSPNTLFYFLSRWRVPMESSDDVSEW